jgi:hypothetical protein
MTHARRDLRHLQNAVGRARRFAAPQAHCDEPTARHVMRLVDVAVGFADRFEQDVLTLHDGAFCARARLHSAHSGRAKHERPCCNIRCGAGIRGSPTSGDFT